MLVTLEEIKGYLRVDDEIDDGLLQGLITTAEKLCQGIIQRENLEELAEEEKQQVKTAVLYSTAYLYEHREEADHHNLVLTLRSLLFGVRQAQF